MIQPEDRIACTLAARESLRQGEMSGAMLKEVRPQWRLHREELNHFPLNCAEWEY